MGLFGNSFGLSERLSMSQFIHALDEAASAKLVRIYNKEPAKTKLCSDIKHLPASQNNAVLWVVSLMILAQLREAFPKSEAGLSKKDLVTRQEGVMAIASKLPDSEFTLALVLMMRIQNAIYF